MRNLHSFYFFTLIIYHMSFNRNNTIIPLSFIGIMFFAIGFALGINSLLVPVLQGSLEISNAASYLIIAATFIPFLIFGYPAGLTIKAIGYKKTMSLSFFIFAIAFYLFILSANDSSFTLFLLASFVSGAANAYLQASVNPYITILGPLESAAKRISIMGICNKLAWPIPSIFIVWLIGKDVSTIGISDLESPFRIIIFAFIFLGIIALLAPLPEVKAEGEDSSSSETADASCTSSKSSVFQFPHLLLGCVALFLYVGVETVSLGTLVDYANSIGLSGAANYAWIAPIGIVIGYICGIILIPRYINQATALKICSIIAIVGSLLVVMTPSHISIYFVSLMALGCSLMWPALWPLAIADLGPFTKTGSSLLIMAMFGGAVIPTVYGWLKDSYGPQQAYWLCLPCFLFILYYAMYGCKIRTK